MHGLTYKSYNWVWCKVLVSWGMNGFVLLDDDVDGFLLFVVRFRLFRRCGCIPRVEVLFCCFVLKSLFWLFPINRLLTFLAGAMARNVFDAFNHCPGIGYFDLFALL